MTTEHLKKTTLIYVDPKKLMETQMALIDLGRNLLEFCDFVQDILREKFYGLLTKILRRDELERAQLEVTKDATLKSKKQRADQIHILTQYCFFLVELLKKTTQNMQHRQIEPYKREFLETAVGLTFFRVPKFRTFMLANATGFQRFSCSEEQLSAINDYCGQLYHASELKQAEDLPNTMLDTFDW